MAASSKKETLLLCFIHGFKGGEDTFGPEYAFTTDLRNILLDKYFSPLPSSTHSSTSFPHPSADPRFAHQTSTTSPTADASPAHPLLDVQVAVYPRYETRGDLSECVTRFRDWLLERVIDIEVSHGTPSPTIEPSVRVVLCGHSMGGIVAAETVIALTSDQPVPFSSHTTTTTGAEKDEQEQQRGQQRKSTTAAPTSERPGLNSMAFPRVQGVLAFDTPFLGIAPGVVAHGAEGHYHAASAAVTQFSGLSAAVSELWAGDAGKNTKAGAKKPVAALPAPPSATNGTESSWGRWSRIAMYAGAGAVAVGGAAAAYMNRNELTQGFTWVSSHLEFVGCLARPEELKRRVGYMALVQKKLNIGIANLYTRLGKGADAKPLSGPGGGGSVVATVLGKDRTFCNLPDKQPAGIWEAQVNNLAEDEASAHMGMFEPKLNPGYQRLCEDAARLIASWTDEEWYNAREVAQITST